MKTNNFSNNFECANVVINETKKERKEWHSEERKLSRLLRLCQEKRMQNYSFPLFKKVGLPTTGKLKKDEFLTYVVNFVDVKGVKTPAYLRSVKVYERGEDGKVKKDASGAYIVKKDEKGDDVTELKLTAIKEGTWTLEKLLKACAK